MSTTTGSTVTKNIIPKAMLIPNFTVTPSTIPTMKPPMIVAPNPATE